MSEIPSKNHRMLASIRAERRKAARRELGICGVVSHSGPGGEPLACGYTPSHTGQHSWASLPTFPTLTPEEEE